MPITIQDVKKVAKLAKLQFQPQEQKRIAKQLDQIVIYMKKLNELETDMIEPTSHVIDLKNIFRDDKSEGWIKQEEALENAPAKKKGYFSVPKVIG